MKVVGLTPDAQKSHSFTFQSWTGEGKYNERLVRDYSLVTAMDKTDQFGDKLIDFIINRIMRNKS